jgi:branched-chain amino acid transport system ATP-binding protein
MAPNPRQQAIPVPEALLKVAGVHAGYGDVPVLWGIDMEVAQGEIVCLVGSNGAGKTTLMRTISGLLPVTAGTLSFDGRAMGSAQPEQALGAGIAQVPEGRRLFSAMSVRDNLLMGAYLRTDSAVAADLERMFDLFPILRQRQGQHAGTLSGGEQQMCAIARGLMSAPRLLLIDELSLGLAPAVVDQLCDTLRTLNSAGLTLLVVEQDVAIALDLADHAFVMDTGRIVRSGDARELANDPAIREAYLGAL